MPHSFQVSLAPQQLWQAINPWSFSQTGQFGLINIELGQTPRPDVESRILEEVGSYGRQLGRIGDALAVIIDHMPLRGLKPKERRAIDALRGQLEAIRSAKEQAEAAGRSPPAQAR